MASCLSISVVIAIMLVQGQPQSALAFDWWMEAPYGNDSFNIRVKYGENTSMVCQDHQYHPEPAAIQYWLLPDMTIMNGSERREFRVFGGTAGWLVSDDGTTMHVYTVQERHFGFYHCVTYSGRDGVYVIKKALNFKGAYFGDLWPQYEKGVIIGCSAAGGFLILMTLFCVVYECRNPDQDFESLPTDDDKDKQLENSEKLKTGEIVAVRKVVIDFQKEDDKKDNFSEHDNFAMTFDDNKVNNDITSF